MSTGSSCEAGVTSSSSTELNLAVPRPVPILGFEDPWEKVCALYYGYTIVPLVHATLPIPLTHPIDLLLRQIALGILATLTAILYGFAQVKPLLVCLEACHGIRFVNSPLVVFTGASATVVMCCALLYVMAGAKGRFRFSCHAFGLCALDQPTLLDLSLSSYSASHHCHRLLVHGSIIIFSPSNKCFCPSRKDCCNPFPSEEWRASSVNLSLNHRVHVAFPWGLTDRRCHDGGHARSINSRRSSSRRNALRDFHIDS